MNTDLLYTQPVLEAHTRISGVGTWTYYLMPVKHQTVFSYNILWLSNVLFICFKRPLGKCLSFTFRSMSCFHVQLLFSVACSPQEFFVFWQVDSDSQNEVFLLLHINNLPVCETHWQLSHGLHLEEGTTTFKTEGWHISFASWISTEPGSQGSFLPSLCLWLLMRQVLCQFWTWSGSFFSSRVLLIRHVYTSSLPF